MYSNSWWLFKAHQFKLKLKEEVRKFHRKLEPAKKSSRERKSRITSEQWPAFSQLADGGNVLHCKMNLRSSEKL